MTIAAGKELDPTELRAQIKRVQDNGPLNPLDVESEKASLKFNIQKTKIMASSPITSWQIDGETMETIRDFIFLGSRITALGDCSMNLKDACSLEEKR